MTLEIDIINGRYKKFYADILEDLDNAKTAYQNDNLALANLYMGQAETKSNILIAERLDILGKIFMGDDK